MFSLLFNGAGNNKYLNNNIAQLERVIVIIIIGNLAYVGRNYY
jgi:hypothetical protein